MTTLVESKKAQLVIISHDVDPIEVSLSKHFTQGLYFFFKNHVVVCNDEFNFFT